MTTELTVQKTVNLNDAKTQDTNALFLFMFKTLKWIPLRVFPEKVKFLRTVNSDDESSADNYNGELVRVVCAF